MIPFFSRAHSNKGKQPDLRVPLSRHWSSGVIMSRAHGGWSRRPCCSTPTSQLSEFLGRLWNGSPGRMQCMLDIVRLIQISRVRRLASGQDIRCQGQIVRCLAHRLHLPLELPTGCRIVATLSGSQSSCGCCHCNVVQSGEASERPNIGVVRMRRQGVREEDKNVQLTFSNAGPTC